MVSQVYVIGSPGTVAVKIGYSSNPEKRLANLQAGSPLPLSVLATFEGGQHLEAAIHRRLKDKRLHGEWFDLGDTPVETVRAVIGRIAAGRAEVTPEPPAAPEWPLPDHDRPYWLSLKDRQEDPDRCWCGHQAGWHSADLDAHPCGGDCPYGGYTWSPCLCSEYDASPEAIAEAQAWNNARRRSAPMG